MSGFGTPPVPKRRTSLVTIPTAPAERLEKASVWPEIRAAAMTGGVA